MSTRAASGAVAVLDGVEVRRSEGGRIFDLEIARLQLGAGELVAVVGPSGSGKSTLLDVLGLILAPLRAGRFEIVGSEVPFRKGRIPGAAKRRREIGFVLQHGALLPFLTVRDNVLLGSALARKKAGRVVVEDLLSRLGLAGLESALPAKISGGQRQRVALARALASDPALLLADEPTGSVDVRQAREIGLLLRDFTRERGTGTVLVTHDELLAREVADRICRIEAEFPGPGWTRSRLVTP